jgi:hypothetical protein
VLKQEVMSKPSAHPELSISSPARGVIEIKVINKKFLKKGFNATSCLVDLILASSFIYGTVVVCYAYL